MLEREVEAQVHEETHAEAHIEQTADCGHGDVDGHGRREHEGQEHDGPAERLNGGNTQEGVAPGNEAHAHGVARRGQDGPDHQQVAEDGVGRLIRAFGGEGGPGDARHGKQHGDNGLLGELFAEEQPCGHGGAKGETGRDDAALRCRGVGHGEGFAEEEQAGLEQDHRQQVFPVALLIGDMAPQAVQRQIDDPGERHAGKNHLHGGERLKRVFHGDHAAAPRCIAQDQQRHQHVLGYGHGSLLKVPAGCERTGYHDVSTDFRWLCPTNLMQMRHFCKNGKMKGMGAERGKTQNAAFLFRKNREGYVAFTVCAYTVR